MIANTTNAITYLFHNPVTQKLSTVVNSITIQKVAGAAHVAFGMLAVALKSHYIGIALLVVGVAIFVVEKPKLTKILLIAFPFLKYAMSHESQAENKPQSPSSSASSSSTSAPASTATQAEEPVAQASSSSPIEEDQTATVSVPTPAPSPKNDTTAAAPAETQTSNATEAGSKATKVKSHEHLLGVKTHSHRKKHRPTGDDAHPHAKTHIAKNPSHSDPSGHTEASGAKDDAKTHSHRKKHRPTGDDSHSHAKPPIEKEPKESFLQPPGLDTAETTTAHPVEHELHVTVPHKSTTETEDPKEGKKGNKSLFRRIASFNSKSKPAVSTPRVETESDEKGAKEKDKKGLAKSHSEIHSREKRDDMKKPKAS